MCVCVCMYVCMCVCIAMPAVSLSNDPDNCFDNSPFIPYFAIYLKPSPPNRHPRPVICLSPLIYESDSWCFWSFPRFSNGNLGGYFAHCSSRRLRLFGNLLLDFKPARGVARRHIRLCRELLISFDVPSFVRGAWITYSDRKLRRRMCEFFADSNPDDYSLLWGKGNEVAL